ncbi:MAG: hypothetical protein U9N46_09300 [Euryarchaeota archaeon]|nr:hypothetical protein [Euryarchaeota archaeon]
MMEVNIIFLGITMTMLLLALPADASDCTLGIFGNETSHIRNG